MEKIVAVIVGILVVAAVIALSIGSVGLLYWIVCWAFHLTFSWKIAIGIWAILAIIRSIFNHISTN